MDDEGGFGDWEEEETPAEEAPPAEEEIEYDEDGNPIEKPPAEAPAEGEGDGFDFGDIPEGEGEGEPQGPPEPKLRWSKWERPKSHIYDYNYGYFNNYYSGVLDQLDERNLSHKYYQIKPQPEEWAVRSSRMYKSMKDQRLAGTAKNDVELLHKNRHLQKAYFVHSKEFSRRFIGSSLEPRIFD